MKPISSRSAITLRMLAGDSSRPEYFDSYQRGALMIHYLRQEVGDEAFFAALQMYFDRYGGGVATRAEFIGAFEEASGRDLGDFFFRWLETLNYP
jgi:aminopeptidase N